MANPDIELFNFYRRYLWNENDFTAWQAGMVNHSRGMFEGLLGGAVLSGFGISIVGGGGLSVDVAPGLASSASGYLCVASGTTRVAFTQPASLQERALIVARPTLVNNTFITNPTNPSQTVPLRVQQTVTIMALRGVAASAPAYPATVAGDVVLCGVRLKNGQVDMLSSDLDFDIRDGLGRNSNFQQDNGRWDDRLRCYRGATPNVLAINPSQLEPPFARVYSYVYGTQPSMFPRTSALGGYNGGVSFIDFNTGIVSGGDLATGTVPATIPTAGNSIVGCVSLTKSDTLTVTYGSIGTRAQCLGNIKNLATTGAGSVAFPSNSKPLCYIVLSSTNGSAVTEMDIFDMRGPASATALSTGVAATGVSLKSAPKSAPYTITSGDDGLVIGLKTATAALTDPTGSQINLPAPASNIGLKVTIEDVEGGAESYPVTIHRNASEKIKGLAADLILETNFGTFTLVTDGTDWFSI